ncbi:glycoside hydrolase family 43 protein [Schaalia sp. JY-X159]|uniref:glycoside hydrolase family 43 protein n=1 Tax=Schaalia sp. JY-X159 TaxID=2758575 RepID=UPI00165D6135|nr:glycoside hydrolase family 43 protein [Schaalia sp. JY-X159]
MQKFENPARFEDPELTNPDPFILSYLGTYFCYSTDEEGVRVSSSLDLINWNYHGFAFTDPKRRAFWAPCVIYRNGMFYMYVSDRPRRAEDSHEQRLRVATSPSPLGPFTSLHTLIDGSFAIDADVVFDEDGTPYMFYASNEFTGLSLDRPGTSVVVDRMKDLETLQGEPVPVIVPTLPQEVFAHDRFTDGRDWHTIEGSTFFTHRGTAFMTYSGNAYVRPDYFIGYSRAQLGPKLENLVWSKAPSDHIFDPLMCRSAEVEGTGHNSVVVAPNLVDLWIVYHGRSTAVEFDHDLEQRVMRLDRLHFDGDVLWTDGPTSSSIAPPAPPGIELAGPITTRGSSRADEIVIAQSVGPHISEVWVHTQTGDSGSRFALVPMTLGADNQFALWFDRGTKTVTARQTTNGVCSDIAEAKLRDFDFSSWQPLQLERGLDHVTLRRGNEILISAHHSWRTTKANAAVISQYTATSLGHSRLTEHFDWDASQGGAIASVLKSDTPTQANAHGLWSEAAELTLLRDEGGKDLSIVADFWLPAQDSIVQIAGFADERQIEIMAQEGARQTVRFRANHQDQIVMYLKRSALSGLKCTQKTQ